MSEEKIVGSDKWNREYTETSPIVVAFRELFPDVTLEAAIGSIVEFVNRQKGPDEVGAVDPNATA